MKIYCVLQFVIIFFSTTIFPTLNAYDFHCILNIEYLQNNPCLRLVMMIFTQHFSSDFLELFLPLRYAMDDCAQPLHLAMKMMTIVTVLNLI